MRCVSKRFGQKTALTEISAEVERGDVIGVLGKNGAGKTTLLEVLLGFSPPSEGSATIFGEDCLHLSEPVKARIGFVPQQDELLGFLSIVIVQIAGLGGFAQPPGTIQLGAIIGVQLVGAALLRMLAVRRWRVIDWLRFRPLRLRRTDASARCDFGHVDIS